MMASGSSAPSSSACTCPAARGARQWGPSPQAEAGCAPWTGRTARSEQASRAAGPGRLRQRAPGACSAAGLLGPEMGQAAAEWPGAAAAGRQAGAGGGGGAAAPQTPAAHLLRIVPDGLLAHEQRPGPLRHDGEDVCSGVVRLEGDQLAGHALHVVRQQDLGARRTGRVGGGGSGCELACCQTRPQRLQLSPTAAPGGWAAQRTASRAAGATAGHKKRHPPSRWLSSC
jgi:hypothetical protein